MKMIKIKAADHMPHHKTESIPVTIEISGNCSEDTKNFNYDHGMDEAEKYFDDQAQQLFDALINALPQGTVEPLTIKLMQHRVSLYHGVMK